MWFRRWCHSKKVYTARGMERRDVTEELVVAMVEAWQVTSSTYSATGASEPPKRVTEGAGGLKREDGSSTPVERHWVGRGRAEG